MMSRSTLGRIAGLTVGIAAIAVALIATTGAANAADFRTKTYQLKKTVHSPELNACLTITLSGKVEYTRHPASGSGGGLAAANRTLVNPRMTVKSWRGTRCLTERERVPLTAITMKQRWYEHGCNGNLGLSIGGPPWSVSVQPTISCGEITVASRSSSSSADSSSYSQANSGRPVNFGGRVFLNTRHKCVAVDASIVAHKGNRSDSFNQTFKVCLS